MKVTVVTACYNSAATIAFTLESFLAQTHPDKELIVVDGGSTDATLALARTHAMANVVVISEPDEGIYDAMNKGFDRYSGDAVGFLNSDDRFADRHCLAHIATALEDADMAYGHLDFVADHVSHRVVRRWRSSTYRPGAFKAGWMPAHPTFYIRRHVAEAVGRFDRRFRVAADYDYMLQAFELYPFRSVLIDRVLIEMQQGGASTRGVSAYLRSNLESYRSRRMRLGTGRFDPALLAKPLRKLPQLLAK